MAIRTLTLTMGSAAAGSEFTIGAATITLDGTYTLVTHMDGVVCIVAPSGCQITGVTPARVADARTTNGVWKNPIAFGSQPWDSDGAQYDAANAASYPLALVVHDSVVGAVSQEDYAGNIYNGVVSQYWGCYVAATAPNPNTNSPALIKYTGQTTIAAPAVIDFEEKAALFPNWTISAVTEPAFSVWDNVFKWNPVFGWDSVWDTYQSLLPFRWSGGSHPSQANYAERLLRPVDGTPFLTSALFSDAYTVSQKAAILQRIHAIGRQTYVPIKGHGVLVGGDGGHAQMVHTFAPLYLWLEEDASGLETVYSDMGGNLYWEPFQLTRSILDTDCQPWGDGTDLSASGSTNLPWFVHRRRIAAISGNTITLPFWRGSGIAGDDSKLAAAGYLLTSAADVASITPANSAVVSSDTLPGTLLAGDWTYTVTVGSVPSGWDTSTDVWFYAQDGLRAGDWDWCVTEYASNKTRFHPLRDIPYRQWQIWSPSLLPIAYFGALTDEMWPAWEYMLRTDQASEPPSNDYDSVATVRADLLMGAIWSENKAAILAVSQPNITRTNPTPFASGDWSVAGGSGQITITLGAGYGGYAGCVGIWYRIDGGRWVDTGRITSGSVVVTGLSAGAKNIELLAVGALGERLAVASDTKVATVT